MSETTPDDKPEKSAGPKKLTTKRIQRRMEFISTESKPHKFQKKRHAMAIELIKQIADGTIARPQGAAKTFLNNYPEDPADAVES